MLDTKGLSTVRTALWGAHSELVKTAKILRDADEEEAAIGLEIMADDLKSDYICGRYNGE